MKIIYISLIKILEVDEKLPEELYDVIGKIMSLVMLNEDNEKYRGEVIKILELFDELDYFNKYISELTPLYHPLEEEGVPRDDEVKTFTFSREDLSPYVEEDGYIVAPPIKGVKKIRRR